MSGTTGQPQAEQAQGTTEQRERETAPAFGIDEQLAVNDAEDFTDGLNSAGRQIELPDSRAAMLASDLEPANLTGNDALGRTKADDQVVVIGQGGEQIGDVELPEEAVATDRNTERMTRRSDEQLAAFDIDAEKDLMDHHVQMQRQNPAFNVSESWANSQGMPALTGSAQGQAMSNEQTHDQSRTLGYGR